MDLTTNDARLGLVRKWATKYGLDPYLVCAVCEQESGWDPYASRFEPGFLSRYVKPKNPSAPTTHEINQATSFGLCQVMGGVALELGWQSGSLLRLVDPDIGVDFGCRKLQECFKRYPGDDEKALLAYNGGGNPDYGKQVLGRMEKYYITPATGAV